MAFNDDEDLDYISTSPAFKRPTKEVIADERDLPTLKQIQRQLEADIASYKTTDRLVLGSKIFTIEEQMAINVAIATHLSEYRAMANNAISNVKEALNG